MCKHLKHHATASKHVPKCVNMSNNVQTWSSFISFGCCVRKKCSSMLTRVPKRAKADQQYPRMCKAVKDHAQTLKECANMSSIVLNVKTWPKMCKHVQKCPNMVKLHQFWLIFVVFEVAAPTRPPRNAPQRPEMRSWQGQLVVRLLHDSSVAAQQKCGILQHVSTRRLPCDLARGVCVCVCTCVCFRERMVFHPCDIVGAVISMGIRQEAAVSLLELCVQKQTESTLL